MTIRFRWNNPWLRALVYVLILAAYVIARAHEVRFIYQGF